MGVAIGALLTACKLFENFDKILKKDKLQRIADGVMRVSFRVGARKILAIWVNINNSLFGYKLISWRAFGVSALLTNVWAMIFIGLFSLRYPAFREWLWNIITLSSLRWPALTTYASILVIEFLSICLTRKIYRATLSKGNKFFVWALLLDLLGSFFLYYIGLAFAKLAFLHHASLSPAASLAIWLDPNNLTMILRALNDFDISSFKPDGHGNFTSETPFSNEVVYAFPEGIFFVTSILTSIWLWGYIAAYSLAYVCVRIDKLQILLWRSFKIEEQPLLVLSMLSGSVFFLIYFLLGLIDLIIKITQSW